jgi:hypothetical protein
MNAPQGIPESFEEHVALMFELQTVAYQADLTRVATFMMSREASQRTYPQIEVGEPHHTISHHGNDPQKKIANAKINRYHADQFAKFVEKLSKTADGDGSLLDHSLIFYGSGMGDSNAHATDPLHGGTWSSSPFAEAEDAGGESVARRSGQVRGEHRPFGQQ